jgi:hypothetical protein
MTQCCSCRVCHRINSDVWLHAYLLQAQHEHAAELERAVALAEGRAREQEAAAGQAALERTRRSMEEVGVVCVHP